MAFTVFIYKGLVVQNQKNFAKLADAFKYLGELDLETAAERCVLDDGAKILFDLKRDKDGNLTT